MKNVFLVLIGLMLFINLVLSAFLIINAVVTDRRIDKLNNTIDELSDTNSETYTAADGKLHPALDAAVGIPDENNDEELWVEIWVDEDYNIHRTGVDSDVTH